MASNKFLAGIATLVFAASAQAAPVSLSANTAANSHSVFGQWTTFNIDVNSLLLSKGLGSQDVTGAKLTVSAYSQAALAFDGYTYDGSTTTTETRPKPGNCNNVNCAPVDVTTTYQFTKSYKDEVADTMWVLAGNTWGYDVTEQQTSLSDYVTDKNPYAKSGNDRQGWYKQFNSIRTSVSSYSGNLDVTLDLDAKALTDLSKDGILSFFVYGGWGQFDVKSYGLNLTAQATPLAPAETQVPVPTSLLLTGLGLAALGSVRRRRKA
ncbi:PEP-CTERM sorting domain-containing protein [Massilia sp. SR12]